MTQSRESLQNINMGSAPRLLGFGHIKELTSAELLLECVCLSKEREVYGGVCGSE